MQLRCNQIHHPKTNTFRLHCLLVLVLLSVVLVVLFHCWSHCHHVVEIEIAEAAVRGENSPGFTLCGLAWENNIQGNQIRCYINSLPELRRLVHKKGGNSMKHSGRPTSLANAKELCEWVVILRHEGMPISINMVILRVSQLNE